MVDPVPYEPAENVPPIVLWRQLTPSVTPGPFNAVEVPEDETGVTFTVPIREYNLDDTIDARIFIDATSLNRGLVDQSQIGPSTSRSREATFTVSTTTGPLADPDRKCHKVMIVISDRGWDGSSPRFYDVPVDAAGEPVTVPAIVQWLAWVDDPAVDRQTQIGECANVMFPE